MYRANVAVQYVQPGGKNSNRWAVNVKYRGADKSLARLTSRCIFLKARIFRLMLVLFYLYIYIDSTKIPPIIIINRIYETKYLLSL
jgi:hypothetical protein